MAGLNWTPPKRLTFFERMKLTYALLSLNLRPLAGFIKAMWRSGASVSFSRTGRGIVSVRIVSADGPIQRYTMTVKRQKTPP